MSERDMRGKVVRALAPLHAISVENPALPGTPDVNYVEGWIELKWLRAWPAQDTGIVRFEHFSPQQRVWHLKRRQAGGRSWVLVQCRREWLLFDGAVAALHLGRCSRSVLYGVAVEIWDGGLNKERLATCVSQRQNVFSLTAGDAEKIRQLLRAAIE